MGIETYSDSTKPNYGQFINYPIEGLKKRLGTGESFQSLYRGTCATKQMISDAWGEFCREHAPRDERTKHLRKIEFALFKLSQRFSYSYEENDAYGGTFHVFEQTDNEILTIAYLSRERFSATHDYCSACASLPNADQALVIDYDEAENSIHISSVIRKAINDKNTVNAHRAWRKDHFEFGRAFEDCDDNYDAICSAKVCGCFSCSSVFTADKISEFDAFDSACCPYCGNSTVIADSQGYTITKDYLDKVARYTEPMYEDLDESQYRQ